MTADQPPARRAGRARRLRPGPALALGLVLACVLALAACGSSSSSSSSAGAASAAATTGGRFNRTALVACLKQQGITLPTRPPRTGGPPTGGGLFGGGGRRFGFASNPKLRAALQKCGLTPGARRFGSFRTSPAFKTAVNNFVTCVRKNGYDLPNPNLSGNGPVFKASQVNRKDPKFVAAAAKCQSLLRFARPGSFGGGGGGTATTAPGTATQ